MNNGQNNIDTHAVLTLPIGEIQKLEPRISAAIEGIEHYRKIAQETFKIELMSMKMKNADLSSWTIDNDNSLYITTSANIGYTHSIVKEYNDTIRFIFKRSLKRMYTLQKSVIASADFPTATISIPSDLLNLFWYFDVTNEESKLSVESYMNNTIRKFFKKYTVQTQGVFE